MNMAEGLIVGYSSAYTLANPTNKDMMRKNILWFIQKILSCVIINAKIHNKFVIAVFFNYF